MIRPEEEAGYKLPAQGAAEVAAAQQPAAVPHVAESRGVSHPSAQSPGGRYQSPQPRRSATKSKMVDAKVGRRASRLGSGKLGASKLGRAQRAARARTHASARPPESAREDALARWRAVADVEGNI